MPWEKRPLSTSPGHLPCKIAFPISTMRVFAILFILPAVFCAPTCPNGRCDVPRIALPVDSCKDRMFEVGRDSDLMACKDVGLTYEFPEDKPTSKLIMTPLEDKPLDAFTVDLLYYMEKAGGDPFILSYATSKSDNELVIGPKRGVHITSGPLTYELEPAVRGWTRLTATWKSECSKVKLYINETLASTGTKSNHVIEAGGVWMLGQEQDSVGGQLDPNQRFVGKISQFRMWDRELTEDELKGLFSHGMIEPANVFDNPDPLDPEARYYFPEPSPEARVMLQPLTEEPLSAFTFDIMYYLEKKVEDSVFILSYATPRSDNELLIGPQRGVHINSGPLTTDLEPMLNGWTRLTVTWSVESAEVKVYVNGTLAEKGDHNGASSIQSGGVWMLAQDQDEVGGKLDTKQRFIGTLKNFRLWSRVLSEQELKNLVGGGVVTPGDVFDNPIDTSNAKSGAVVTWK